MSKESQKEERWAEAAGEEGGEEGGEARAGRLRHAEDVAVPQQPRGERGGPAAGPRRLHCGHQRDALHGRSQRWLRIRVGRGGVRGLNGTRIIDGSVSNWQG